MNIIPQLGTSLSIGFCSLGGMLVNQHTHASTAYTMWKLEDLSYLYLLMVASANAGAISIPANDLATGIW